MNRLWLVAGLALCCAAPPAVRAHETWAGGEDLPAWVKRQCCGVSDAHRLEPGQVRQVPGGYQVEGYPDIIPAAMLLPSEDGDWWVFYRMHPDRSFSKVFCFFGPMTF